MTKNVRRTVRHKILMFALWWEDTTDPEMTEWVRQQVETACDLIEPEYDAKGRTGALWLDRMLKAAKKFCYEPLAPPDQPSRKHPDLFRYLYPDEYRRNEKFVEYMKEPE